MQRNELDELAYAVRRLQPSHRNPEAYFIEKDLIARKLKRLARRADRQGWEMSR